MSLIADYLYLDQGLAGWRAEGLRQRVDQQWRADRYEAYYDGRRPSAYLAGNSRDIFRALLPMARTNWSELVVNAVAERLRVDDFRFGDSSGTAWDIWQASDIRIRIRRRCRPTPWCAGRRSCPSDPRWRIRPGWTSSPSTPPR